MTSLKRGTLLLSGLFVLAACGGGGTSATQGPQATPGAPAVTVAPGATATAAPAATTPATGTIDTCKLFTVADLKTATGADYGAGEGAYGLCTYRVGGATANNGDGQIVVSVLEQPLSFVKAAFSAGGVDTTVSGKPAFWNPTEGLQSLWIDLGAQTLVLSFDPVDETTQGIAVKVGELAVATL